MGYVPLITNFLPTQRGTMKKRQGFTFVSEDITDEEYLELFEWGDALDNIRVVGIRNNHLYSIDTALEENDEGSLGTDSNRNRVFFATYGGSGFITLYFTRGKDQPIYAWQPEGQGRESGTISPEEIATTSFFELSADCILQQGGHLVLANTSERVNEFEEDGSTETVPENYPYRIRWSRFGSPEDFTVSADTTGGFIDLILDEENAPILSIVPLREFMVVYKKNSIYNLTNRGGGIFYPELKCSFRGAISHKAIAPVQDGNRHLVVSSDNIYIYDGFGFKYPPIGDKVKNFFYNDLDYTKKDDIYVKSIPHRYECWIFYDNTDEERVALCWNWQRDSWTHHDIPVRSMVNADNLIDNPKNAILIGVGGPHAKIDNNRRGLATAFQGNHDAGTAIEAIIRYPIQALIGRDGEYKDHSWVNFVEVNAYPLPDNANSEEDADGFSVLKDTLVCEDAGVYELQIIFADSTVLAMNMESRRFVGRTFSTATEWEELSGRIYWREDQKVIYNLMVYICIQEYNVVIDIDTAFDLKPDYEESIYWESLPNEPVILDDKHKDRVIFPCNDMPFGAHRYLGAMLICKSPGALEEINELGIEHKYNPNPNQQ